MEFSPPARFRRRVDGVVVQAAPGALLSARLATRHMVRLLLLLSFLSTAVQAQDAGQDAPSSVPDAVVAWVRAHAVPLAGADPALPTDDLGALAPVFGDARVVGVGEGTHGTREFFQFRDRLVRWLAAARPTPAASSGRTPGRCPTRRTSRRRGSRRRARPGRTPPPTAARA